VVFNVEFIVMNHKKDVNWYDEKARSVNKIIGMRIKKFRREQNIKRGELGLALCLSRSQIINYETGRSIMPVYLLLLIAQCLKKDITCFTADT
jgi:DNA-binding XRE family transcriptional regulator